MKNLKLFVFALCAVLLSVVTVNAAQPVATIGNLTCDTDVTPCLEHAFDNGGTLNLYQDFPVNTARATKEDLTINAHGHVLTFNVSYTAANGKTLNVQDMVVKASNNSVIPFVTDAKSTLYLNNVTATNVWVVVKNEGTATVNGGKITSAATTDVFRNYGLLTLNNGEVTATKGVLVNVEKHGTVTTVNGGTYNTNHLLVSPATTPAPEDLAAGTAAQTAAKVVLNDGTYTTEEYGMVLERGINVIIEKGTIKAKANNTIAMAEAALTVNGGTIMSVTGNAIYVAPVGKATLKITNGLVQSNQAGHYALYLENKNATYAISGGTFESKPADKKQAAIYLKDMAVKVDKDTITLDKSVVGILTGGKYLNSIVAEAEMNGLKADVTNQLVAEGYTVKTEDPYKVVVSTKTSTDTTKPGAPGKEEAPNTFDAGLVYMGLALSAIGASVVSVRKLRNN